VVAVNQQFARRYFGDIDRAIGRTIDVRPQLHEVIAVVGDVREQDLTAPLDPAVYRLLPNATPGRIVLFSKEIGPVAPALLALTAAIRSADSRVYATPGLLSDRIRSQTAASRMQMTLIGFLSLFSTLLAGLGIYSLVAQLSADRIRELGIRAALGATGRSLVALLMRTILGCSLAGIAGGVVLTLFTVGLLNPFLFEVGSFAAGPWATALGLVLLTSTTAAWLPARRAAQLSPMHALKRE
jgi:ABC-type antimicrobial peptide transport system permease subunit